MNKLSIIFAFIGIFVLHNVNSQQYFPLETQLSCELSVANCSENQHFDPQSSIFIFEVEKDSLHFCRPYFVVTARPGEYVLGTKYFMLLKVKYRNNSIEYFASEYKNNIGNCYGIDVSNGLGVHISIFRHRVIN